LRRGRKKNYPRRGKNNVPVATGPVARLPLRFFVGRPRAPFTGVASQARLGFIQPPGYVLSPTAPPRRGLEEDQPVVFLAVGKGRLADGENQLPIWPHPSEQVLRPRLVLVPHLELSAVVLDLRFHVLVPDQAVIGTRH